MLKQELPLPSAKQAITEVSVDGGKACGELREKVPKERDYKAVREHRAFITVLFSKTTNLQLTGLIVSA